MAACDVPNSVTSDELAFRIRHAALRHYARAIAGEVLVEWGGELAVPVAGTEL
jgi:hypothetical protein